MKKYSSGSFIDAALRVYGSEADNLTSFPASIIANGGNITPWTVYGNTVEGVSVGERTAQLFDKNLPFSEIGKFLNDDGTIAASSAFNITDYIECDSETDYSLSNVNVSSNFPSICYYDSNKDFISGTRYNGNTGVSFTTPNTCKYVKFSVRSDKLNEAMFNTGSTALPYEPYGYKVTISCNNVDYNCYISDVLRKSTGADPVYDIMSSTGVITRNVDTDGTPLVTPTTESFTAPTLATVAGSQSVSFNTTVKPSKAELTYTGWHTHSDKKRSGGAWT